MAIVAFLLCLTMSVYLFTSAANDATTHLQSGNMNFEEDPAFRDKALAFGVSIFFTFISFVYMIAVYIHF